MRGLGLFKGMARPLTQLIGAWVSKAGVDDQWGNAATWEQGTVPSYGGTVIVSPTSSVHNQPIDVHLNEIIYVSGDLYEGIYELGQPRVVWTGNWSGATIIGSGGTLRMQTGYGSIGGVLAIAEPTKLLVVEEGYLNFNMTVTLKVLTPRARLEFGALTPDASATHSNLNVAALDVTDDFTIRGINVQNPLATRFTPNVPFVGSLRVRPGKTLTIDGDLTTASFLSSMTSLIIEGRLHLLSVTYAGVVPSHDFGRPFSGGGVIKTSQTIRPTPPGWDYDNLMAGVTWELGSLALQYGKAEGSVENLNGTIWFVGSSTISYAGGGWASNTFKYAAWRPNTGGLWNLWLLNYMATASTWTHEVADYADQRTTGDAGIWLSPNTWLKLGVVSFPNLRANTVWEIGGPALVAPWTAGQNTKLWFTQATALPLVSLRLPQALTVLRVDVSLTVRRLRVNGVQVPAGTYVAGVLAGTEGGGTITVLES